MKKIQYKFKSIEERPDYYEGFYIGMKAKWINTGRIVNVVATPNSKNDTSIKEAGFPYISIECSESGNKNAYGVWWVLTKDFTDDYLKIIK